MSDEAVTMNCPFCSCFTSVRRARVSVPAESGGRGTHVDALWNDRRRGEYWWIGICNRCEQVVLVRNHGDRIWPRPQPSAADERVPKHIARDLNEAKNCFSVGAYCGAVVMARRALQAACRLRGAPKAKLETQIDALASKHLITADLKDWAHEVRFVGNEGAHPPEDPEAEIVEQQDASNVLELVEQFLDVLFVAPAIAAEQKERREQKNKKAS